LCSLELGPNRLITAPALRFDGTLFFPPPILLLFARLSAPLLF
jgi:hypothetical protein